MKHGKSNVYADWQRMREHGMTVGEIARQLKTTAQRVSNHTVPPKVSINIQKARMNKIEQMRKEGKSIASMISALKVTKHEVQMYLQRLADAGRIQLNGNERGDISDQAVISPEDVCQRRCLRGLTQEQYERLLEMDREEMNAESK